MVVLQFLERVRLLWEGPLLAGGLLLVGARCGAAAEGRYLWYLYLAEPRVWTRLLAGCLLWCTCSSRLLLLLLLT